MSQTIAARIVDRLGRWIARRHGIVLLVGGMVAIPACWAALSLRPVGNLAAMLSARQPSAQSLARITEAFRGTDELIVLASAPDFIPQEESGNRLMAFARRLTEAMAKSPEAKALVSRAYFEPPDEMRRFAEEVLVPNVAYYLPPEAWDRFRERLDPGNIGERIARLDALVAAPAAAGGAVVKAAMQDPLGIYEFVADLMPGMGQPGAPYGGPSAGFRSPDQRHLMIRIQGREPVADLEFAVRLTDFVSSTAERVNSDGLRLQVTGAYAIAATSQRSIRSDMIFTITGSFVVLQLLFWIGYRELWTFPLAIAPVALGIVFAFAVAKLAHIPLTPMTAVIGGILAGLGIDYCIHPLSRYRYERTLTSERDIAIGRTLADVVPPNAAALVTTASGFLALSLTSVEMVRSFGLIGALGLAGCFVACLFLFPAMLAALPHRSRAVASRQATATRLIRWIASHRAAVAGAAAALACVAGAVAITKPLTLIEGDLSVLHPRPNAALTAQRELVNIFGAANEPWLIHLQAEDNARLVAAAREVDRRLSAPAVREAGVAGSLGLATLLPDPAIVDARRTEIMALNADDIVSAFRSSLDKSALNPEAFAGYESFLRRMLQATDPPMLATLREYPEIASLALPAPDRAKGRGEAIAAVFLSTVLDDRAARDRAIEVIRDALAGVPEATLTGLSVVGRDLEEQIKTDLSQSMWIADVMVLGCLLLYFRSVKYALLAAIPPAFAALLLYAGMQVLGIRLNLVNLVGLPLLVGIGVDNGVFLTSLVAGGDDSQPLIERMGAATHAITMTTLTTVLTFGSLLLTSTPAIRSLGILMGIGVTAALVGALGLLCPILVGQRARGFVRGED